MTIYGVGKADLFKTFAKGETFTVHCQFSIVNLIGHLHHGESYGLFTDPETFLEHQRNGVLA